MKKNKIIVAIILMLVVIFGLLSGVVIGIFVNGNPNENILVTDVFCKTVSENGREYCFHIPKINIESHAITEINKKIYDTLYEKFYGDSARTYEMSYEWGSKDDIVSITVQASDINSEKTEFYVFNVDIKEEREISDEELYALYGYDIEEARGLIKNAVKQYSDKRLEELGGGSYYEALIEKTLSGELISEALPFIDKDGVISAVVHLFSESRERETCLHIIELVTGKIKDYFDCDGKHDDVDYTDDNSSQKENEKKDNSENEKLLTEYYRENLRDCTLSFLADVTKDGMYELITVYDDGMIVKGYVHYVSEDKAELIYEKTGAHSHAGGFFAWYIKESGTEGQYQLVEEGFGMWQGLGELDTEVYYLDADGDKIVTQTASVKSLDSDITEEAINKYDSEVSAVVGNSYDIAHTSSHSNEAPKTIDKGDFVLLKYNGIEYTEDSSDELQSEPLSGDETGLNKEQVVKLLSNALLTYSTYTNRTEQIEKKLDMEDCIYSDDPIFGAVPYYRRNYDTFNSISELKEYMMDFFDEELCDSYLSCYKEQDGKLYVCSGNAFGMVYKYSDLTINQQDSDSISFTVSAVSDFGQKTDIDYHAIRYNDNWVFTGEFTYID